MKDKGFKLVLTAMFAAMVCVCTMVVHIPSPVGGYIHLGDALVLMSGLLLGPVYGGIAAGLGSALADLLLSYVIYVPGTFIIKFAVAAIASLLARELAKRAPKLNQILRYIIAGIPAEAVMVLGYFVYAAVVMQRGFGAIDGVPGNLMQGLAGIIISCILTPLITKPKEIRGMLSKFTGGDQQDSSES